MIFDTLSHLPQYLPSDVQKVFETFFSRLCPDTTDGKYGIREPDVFAQISSYNTRPPQEGRFENHKRFVDIQILLSGSEMIYVTPLDGLIPDTDYDEQNDIRFYRSPDRPAVQLSLKPGSFAMFFPQDAHCPQLTPHTGVQNVKKVVVKIDSRLLSLDDDSVAEGF